MSHLVGGVKLRVAVVRAPALLFADVLKLRARCIVAAVAADGRLLVHNCKVRHLGVALDIIVIVAEVKGLVLAVVTVLQHVPVVEVVAHGDHVHHVGRRCWRRRRRRRRCRGRRGCRRRRGGRRYRRGLRTATAAAAGKQPLPNQKSDKKKRGRNAAEDKRNLALSAFALLPAQILFPCHLCSQWLFLRNTFPFFQGAVARNPFGPPFRGPLCKPRLAGSALFATVVKIQFLRRKSHLRYRKIPPVRVCIPRVLKGV